MEPEYQVTFPPTPASTPYCSEILTTLARLGDINYKLASIVDEAP